jgi:hypothetical protein
MLLPWSCHGIAMLLPCPCHAIDMFLKDARANSHSCHSFRLRKTTAPWAIFTNFTLNKNIGVLIQRYGSNKLFKNMRWSNCGPFVFGVLTLPPWNERWLVFLFGGGWGAGEIGK